jgi:alkanesulfonate monooxygenase SsuD/methylene tetrahydromethanopterin reductase-like flavin-dependent oxidoreductase (luciferase family)
MQFAFWDALADEDGTDTAATYDRHIRLAQRIEALGWSMYFTIEHQNAPQGVTAPTVYLAAVARETSRLRLGAMIWQLPFYQPLRLAQEVALLDQLSKGRVEFGTGIGVHEHEFIRWGVDFYQRAAMRDEVLEVVKRAWTQDEVTFDGQFFHFDEALPRPKPYQQPHLGPMPRIFCLCDSTPVLTSSCAASMID